MTKLGREQWEKLVEELKTSGLTQDAFAARHGVSVNTLQFWIYKLRREEKAPRFVPVHVVASSAPARRSEAGWLELATRSGHLLRFAEGTDPKYLAAVLAELG